MRIENLTKELDTNTMKSVRGGDNGNSTVNTIGQALNLSVPVSIMSGGPTNSSVHVNGTQNARIWNSQVAGDSYLGLLPFVF